LSERFECSPFLGEIPLVAKALGKAGECRKTAALQTATAIEAGFLKGNYKKCSSGSGWKKHKFNLQTNRGY